MMPSPKSLAALLSAIAFGCLVAALIGCQPAAPPGAGGSSVTTEGGPDISVPATSTPTPATEETPAEAKPAEGTPAETPAAEKPAEEKPAEQPAEEKPTEAKPTEEKPAEAAPTPTETAANHNPMLKPGDWTQWGGSSLRNNVPVVENVVDSWNPGKFDRKTGAHDAAKAKNIKWVTPLGTQTYGNSVVAGGKVFLGTNNAYGYLKRYPGDGPGGVDLGVLICLDEQTGKFLWQHSSEKLPTGRVHDWMFMGICDSPMVEGDRLWFVTSRGEVRCLDVNGFYDGKDDGRPESAEPARLFDIPRADDPAEDKVTGYIAELDGGKLPADLRKRFASAGMPLPEGDIAIKADEKAKAPSKKWTFKAKVGDSDRDFTLLLAGPKLSGFKIITPADKEEADVIWAFDMMKELGTSQHNMCSCSVTCLGDILFVNSSNGVDDSHLVVPAPDAPSFIAMNKNTGKVLWTDNSPGKNILHGQWSSPAVAYIDGVPQVLFGGGDGWLYSFKADEGKDGKPELLWKFDINPKETVLELGGRGTRNDIISTPVVYANKVYFCTGQDPEHGEGVGILWCIDPTKRGDISEKLAVNRADPKKPIPHKRVQAVVAEDGDIAIDNPNSGVVWKYETNDANGDGKIDFEEQFHRSIATVAIKDDLLFCPDFSGLLHCVNAQTGKVNWTYDMLAASWGSPLIAGDKVMVGDEDGDVAIFNLSAEKQEPLSEINMLNSVYSTPIVANGTLFIANKDHIFAIAVPGAEAPKAGGGK
jgi:outer membrane protein assembly factor BamB